MIRASVAIAMLLALAGPAGAQPPQPSPSSPPVDDPIDALLKRRPPANADLEEPDTAAHGGRVDPDPVIVGPPSPAPARRPTLTAPVHVDETGRNPDGPATPAQAAYDSRLKSSQASAQGFQGPMDGGWTLLAGERELYILQLIDRNGAVQGAWRDPRRPGALDASGFIDQAERAGDTLTLRLAGGAVLAILHAEAGRWTGELTEGQARHAVSLRRRNP